MSSLLWLSLYSIDDYSMFKLFRKSITVSGGAHTQWLLQNHVSIFV